MAGLIVKVWLEGSWASEGRPLPFHLLDTGFPDLVAFLQACGSDELMLAEQLITRWRPEDRGARVVERTQTIAFRGSAVKRVKPPDFRLIER